MFSENLGGCGVWRGVAAGGLRQSAVTIVQHTGRQRVKDTAADSALGAEFCSARTGIGLYWLGGLQPGTSPIIALAAATVFGVGKTYLWPTPTSILVVIFGGLLFYFKARGGYRAVQLAAVSTSL